MSPTPITIILAILTALLAADQALSIMLPSIAAATHVAGLVLTAIIGVVGQFAPATMGKFKFKKAPVLSLDSKPELS